MTDRATADELRAFVERFERLEADKSDISDAQKDLIAELRGRGYDPKTFRRVIAERKKTPDQRAEEAAILEMYLEVLGGA